MVTVDLFPGTPFPQREIKDFLLTAGNGGDKVHAVSLQFCSAGGRSNGGGQIKLFNALCIVYKIHDNGGRERFQSDMNHLKDFLGGFHICKLEVFFGSCCDDLIPDAVNMFYSASVEYDELANFRITQNELFLVEQDGAGDPAVAAAIVENWRIDSNASGAYCRLYHSSTTSQHIPVFKAIFTKLNLNRVEIHPTDERSTPMSREALGLVSRLLSSPTSSVHHLFFSVTASSESDRLLAFMLKSNKSLRSLEVESDWGSLVVTEMTRAMRETNCTLTDGIFLWQVRGQLSRLALNCQDEMILYAALNRHGRGCMRSTAFQPNRIPKLLESAARAEGNRHGRFLYPILCDNPSSWTGYLGGHREHENEKPPTDRPN